MKCDEKDQYTRIRFTPVQYLYYDNQLGLKKVAADF